MAGGMQVRRMLLFSAALLLPAVLPLTARAGATPTAPAGFEVGWQRDLGFGVSATQLVGAAGEPLVIDVARIPPRPDIAIRPIVSGNEVGGPGGTLERTSEMCRRVECLVAVNGDFALPGSGLPVGGIVRDGHMLRSPVTSHHQLSVTGDGGLAVGSLAWNGQLMPSDLKPLAIDGVNVERQADQLVLYTPALGPSTGTNDFGTELVMRLPQGGTAAEVGETQLVDLESIADGTGNTTIPPDGAVLSGHGRAAAALQDLWARVQAGTASRRALLRIETTPSVTESTGGTPVLVHEGKRWVADDGSSFGSDRHPRTLAGWTADGTRVLVTVDGRQPGYSGGMTLTEAADLMLSLGATEAINLDGGGSTTFVVGGAVVNRPSDQLVRRHGAEQIVKEPVRGDVVLGQVERPVTTALAVVPVEGSSGPPADPLAGQPFGPVHELAMAPPVGDPASDSRARLPALVVPARRPDFDAEVQAVAVALLLVVGVAAASARQRHGVPE